MEKIRSGQSLTYETSRITTPKQMSKQSKELLSFSQKNSVQSRTLPGNPFQVNKLYLRFLRLTRLYCINLFLQIVLAILYVLSYYYSFQYQLSYKGDARAQLVADLMMADSLVSIFLNILTMLGRKQWRDAEKKNVQISRAIFVPFRWIIILVQPYSFLEEIYIQNWNYETSSYIPYKLNYLMANLSFFKFGLLFSCLIEFLKYKSPTSERICKLYGTQNSYLYSLKCYFKQNTVISVSGIFIFSLLYYSFAFRISQRDPYIAHNDFQYFQNCLWFVFITMTTVGYGDVSANTMIGRMFGLSCVFCGVMIVSIMVYVVINTFQMDQSEEQALSLLKSLAGKKQIKNLAGEYIRTALWRVWKNKKLKKLNKLEQIQPQSVTERYLKNHLKLSIQQQKYQNSNEKNFGADMNRQFQKTMLYLQNLYVNADSLLQHLTSHHVIDIEKLKTQCLFWELN